MITAEHFKAATGNDPVDDDLDRANCPEAGQPTHYSCGWCPEHDAPMATHFCARHPLHPANLDSVQPIMRPS